MECTHEDNARTMFCTMCGPKVCRRCDELKPRDSFWKAVRMRDGLNSYCKACSSEAAKQSKLKRPEHYQATSRRWRLESSFGITPERYDEMFARQGGLCALCRRPPGNMRLAVDHCHESGRLRGLLCNLCNTALGRLGDSADGLRRALEYVEGVRA